MRIIFYLLVFVNVCKFTLNSRIILKIKFAVNEICAFIQTIVVDQKQRDDSNVTWLILSGSATLFNWINSIRHLFSGLTFNSFLSLLFTYFVCILVLLGRRKKRIQQIAHSTNVKNHSIWIKSFCRWFFIH